MTTHNEIDEILSNFDTWCVCGKSDCYKSGNFNEATEALTQYIEAQTAEVEKAYGGCHNCYGKGYATVNGVWSGYDTDTDMGSPGGGARGGNPNEMKFCTCDRGKQLRAVVEAQVLANQIEVAEWITKHLKDGDLEEALTYRLATLKKELKNG